jgi:hypothetical protein
MKLKLVVDQNFVLAGCLWVLVVHIKHQHLRQHQQLIVLLLVLEVLVLVLLLVLEVEMLEVLGMLEVEMLEVLGMLEVEMLEVLGMPSLLLMASYF